MTTFLQHLLAATRARRQGGDRAATSRTKHRMLAFETCESRMMLAAASGLQWQSPLDVQVAQEQQVEFLSAASLAALWRWRFDQPSPLGQRLEGGIIALDVSAWQRSSDFALQGALSSDTAYNASNAYSALGDFDGLGLFASEMTLAPMSRQMQVIPPIVMPSPSNEGGSIALMPHAGPAGLMPPMSGEALAEAPHTTPLPPSPATRELQSESAPMENLRARAVVLEVAAATTSAKAPAPFSLRSAALASVARSFDEPLQSDGAVAVPADPSPGAQLEPIPAGDAFRMSDAGVKSSSRPDATTVPNRPLTNAGMYGVANLDSSQVGPAIEASRVQSVAARLARDAAFADWQRSERPSGQPIGESFFADANSKRFIGGALALVVGAGSLRQRWRRSNAPASEQLPPRGRLGRFSRLS